MGSEIVAFSDQWFADAANLITPTPPVRKPGVFVHSGAWYDGWETRRHNPGPFDWVVIRLGVSSGKVQGIEIDTAHFNGNEAPAIAVEGAYAPDVDKDTVTKYAGVGRGGWQWKTILGTQECGPSQRHAWKLSGSVTYNPITHVRLLMFPDGGIARFRLYGNVIPVFPQDRNILFDLAAATMGGVAVSCSDQHFGKKDNILLPGRGVHMGDGWETKRSREKDHSDWVIVRLGTLGQIQKIVLDTAHFRGNYPREFKIHAILCGDPAYEPGVGDEWTEILPPKPCGPDREHEFEIDPSKVEEWTHVKLTILPDGGVSRLRALGRK